MHHDSMSQPVSIEAEGRTTASTSSSTGTSSSKAMTSLNSAHPEYPEETPHLNYHGLKVLDRKDGKGRGVYTSKAMARGDLLDVSPVLLLSKEEYAKPAGVNETVLRDYVFSWDRQGCMAVALGLGSMFNHSKFPNVLYKTDKSLKVTRYYLARNVAPNEELTIYYGPHVKFNEGEESEEETLDGFDALSCVAEGLSSELKLQEQRGASPASDTAKESSPPPESVHILYKDLPCLRVSNHVSLADLPLTTVNVWVADLESKNAPAVFDFLKTERTKHGLPISFLPHAKRMRRRRPSPEVITVLLAEASPPPPPSLLEAVENSPLFPRPPFLHAVPDRPAATKEQIAQFADLWPVNFVPLRSPSSSEVAPTGWSSHHLSWVQTMFRRIERSAEASQKRGDLPVACLVAGPLLGAPLAEATDTRCSSGNFLCHAISNVIHAVAALDVENKRLEEGKPPPYLLSGLSLFTTHEPCLMCSMALLHSRVSVVYYIRPSEGAGGLGSVYHVHEDKGLNHKFEVWKWIGPSYKDRPIAADP